MVDSRIANDWIFKANEDISNAKILLDHSGSTGLIGFLAHQAIEKALKAFLLFKTEQSLKSHSLGYLCRLCAKHDNSFRVFVPVLGGIEEYYIQSRYPADIPLQIGVEDVKFAVEFAEEIISFVKQKISQ